MHIAQASQTQELPDWLRYTTLYNAQGRATATAILQLPLTYSGSSIPLGWPWTQAGVAGPTIVSILGGSFVTLSSSSSLPAQTKFAPVGLATQASGSSVGQDASGEDTSGFESGAKAASNDASGSVASTNEDEGDRDTQGDETVGDQAGQGADGSDNAGNAPNDGGADGETSEAATAAIFPQAGPTAPQVEGSAPTDEQSLGNGGLSTQTEVVVPLSAATASLKMTDGQVVPALVSTLPNGALTTQPLTPTMLPNGSTGFIPLPVGLSRSVTMSNGQIVPAVLTTLSDGIVTDQPLVLTTLVNGQTTLVPIPSSTPSVTLSDGQTVPATVITLSNGALTTQPLVPTTLPNGATSLVPSLAATQGSSGLSGGAIAGITLAAILGALLLGLCGLCCFTIVRKRDMSDERRVLGRDLSWQRSSSYRHDPDVQEAIMGLITYRDSPDEDVPIETASTRLSSRANPRRLSGLSQIDHRSPEAAIAGTSDRRRSPEDSFRLSGSTSGADGLFFSLPRTPPSRNSDGTLRPPLAEHSSSGSGSTQSAYASTARHAASSLPPASAYESSTTPASTTLGASTPAANLSVGALGVANPALRDSTGSSTTATSTAEYLNDDVRRDSALSAEGAPILTAAKETTGRVLSGLGLAQLFGIERTASDASDAPRRTGPIALSDDSPTLGYGLQFAPADAGDGSTRWSRSALAAPILRAGPQRSVSHHFSTASAASPSERRIASESSTTPLGDPNLRRRIGNRSDEDLFESLPYDLR